MKTTLALLLSLAGFSAFAQTSSRPLRFYESIAAMVANRPITNEVLAITQRSGTNAGPLLFFWHAPTAAPTNTVDTFNAPGGGQYRLITNVVTIAIPDGSITTNKWDSVAHQWVSGKLDLSGGTMTGALSNSVSIGSPVIFVGSTNLNTALSAKAPLASPSFTGVVLVNGTNLMSEIAAKQAAFSTSVGITNSGNVLQPVLAGGTNVVLTTNGNAIVINSTASGSGSGNASTNATQGWAAANTNTANGPWIFNGPVTTADLNVSAINFSGVWGFSNGGLGVTNASDARTVLGLVIDTDIQSASTHLLRIARVAWASGDFIWHDGTGLTNFVSTSTGRSLLSAASASAARSAIGAANIAGDTFTGPIFVPYVAYNANWTNSGSNGVPTWRAIAEKIEALSVGGYIASVDTNFDVVGSQLRLTNTVGEGRVLRETAAGTNTAFSGLTDVSVATRDRGEQPWYDGTNWKNMPLASPTANMGEWEEAYTACATTATQTPFTASAVNNGQSGTTGTVMGRQGVWKASTRLSAVDLYTGAVFAGGATSAFLTNRYNAKADLVCSFTNGVIHYAGYSDGLTQAGLTNAPTDALMVTVTNGTMRFCASQGGSTTVASSTFTVPTNIWLRLEFNGTNQVAGVKAYTNSASGWAVAWSESINSANVPNGVGVLLGFGAGAYGTTAASTNGVELLFVNEMGYRWQNKGLN